MNIAGASNYNSKKGREGAYKVLPRIFYDKKDYGSFEFFQRTLLFQTGCYNLTEDGKCGPKTIAEILKAYGTKKEEINQLCQITGKGFWVWKGRHLIPRGTDQRSALKEVAQQFAEHNIKHILFKVADGKSKYNSKYLDDVFEIFTDNGVDVFPWVFSYCYHEKRSLRKEIDLHVKLAKRYSAKALVINAEVGFKDRREINDKVEYFLDYKEDAKEYMASLKHHLSIPLYLSSYGFVKGHRNFAWKEMCDGADVLCPQTYFSIRGYHSDAVGCTQRSIDEWSEFNDNNKPIIPSSGCYQIPKKNGGWKGNFHNPKQIKKFMKFMKESGHPNATFWLYMAEEGTRARITEKQLNAILGFDF